MEVLWTEPAEAHMAATHAFHAQISRRYADRLVDRLTERTRQLAVYPRSGSVIPEGQNLEIRMLVEGSYRILYVVGSGHIEILGILHGSRGSL